MSLQIWLPFTNDIHNQGLVNLDALTPSQNTMVFESNGKLGKCACGTLAWHLNEDILDNTWSVATWFKTSRSFTANNNVIFCKNNTSSTDCQIYFSIVNGTSLHVGVNGSADSLSKAYTFTTNTWYHIATTYDGTTVSLYINGVFQKSTNVTTAKPSGKLNIRINGRSTNANNTTATAQLAGYSFNDFRLYNHCLSAKEVAEIAKGLILWYPLNDRSCEATTNLCTGLTAGGRTTVSNNIVSTTGVDQDTYFTVNLSEDIQIGTQYTISCWADIPSGIWQFPIGSQSNTSLKWVLSNGYNEKTFIANDISWGTKRILLDDITPSANAARATGLISKFYNFQVEKKDHATSFTKKIRGGQYDQNIYQEPDGSRWIRIAHHNNPSNSIFSTHTAEEWQNGVYEDDNKWLCLHSALDQINTYEFMVKQKRTSDATEAKFRWTQNISPAKAKYEDIKAGKVVYNTSSDYTDSIYGGLYIKGASASAYLSIAKTSSGQWWGAFGASTSYEGGIPGHPSQDTVTTGYMDLYIRIDDTNIGKVYDISGYKNNGIITGNLSVTSNSPKYNVATTFNGNSLIEADSLPAETKTISLWVKIYNLLSTSFPIHDKNSGLCLGVYNNGTQLVTYIGSEAGGTGSKISYSFVTNTWYHIVVIKTGDNTRDVYINGIKATPTTNDWYSGDLLKFNIGGRHTNNIYRDYFNGEINDIRIYATALTSEQVTELYLDSLDVSSGTPQPRGLN